MNDHALTITERIHRISAIDFDPIIQRLVRSQHTAWTHERAKSAEREYSRFLILVVKYPEERLVPTVDADEVWHEHIIDTIKYSLDCEHALGRFLHHFPAEVGTSAKLAAEFQRTSELYEREFGEPYLGSAALSSCDSCHNCDGGHVYSEPEPEISGQLRAV